MKDKKKGSRDLRNSAMVLDEMYDRIKKSNPSIAFLQEHPWKQLFLAKEKDEERSKS